MCSHSLNDQSGHPYKDQQEDDSFLVIVAVERPCELARRVRNFLPLELDRRDLYHFIAN